MKVNSCFRAIAVSLALVLSLSMVSVSASEILVTTDNLNVRSGPGLENPVLHTLIKNTYVHPLAFEGGWARIMYNGRYGYCSTDYLRDVLCVPMETVSDLNVRVGPGVAYKVLGTIDSGTKVNVAAVNDDWAAIVYEDSIGYVSSFYLKSLSNSELVLESSSVMESTQWVVVMSRPDNDSEHVGFLSPFEEVEVIEREGEWAKILYEGESAYCLSSFLRDIDEPEEIIESDNGIVYSYKNLDFSVEDFVEAELLCFNFNPSGEPIDAELLTSYISPDAIFDRNRSYQFLKINTFRDNVDVESLDAYLNSLSCDTFHGKAQAFVDAAEECDIDVLYLVAHTLLETGYGKSTLARGVEYKIPSSDGEVVKVYNLFGIGAYDSDPIGGGAATAYENGWTSIDKAILGGAKWISSNYINNTKRNQHTVYLMRWNTNAFNGDTLWHQYASSITWADLIAYLMEKLSYVYDGVELEFEVPVFAK